MGSSDCPLALVMDSQRTLGFLIRKLIPRRIHAGNDYIYVESEQLIGGSLQMTSRIWLPTYMGRWAHRDFVLNFRLLVEGKGIFCHKWFGKHQYRWNFCACASDIAIFNQPIEGGSTAEFVSSSAKDTSLIIAILRSDLNDPKLEVALKQQRFLVSEILVLDILHHHLSEWKAALFFFNWVSGQQGYCHGSRAYNEMLDILGRAKRIESMLEMFDKMPRENVNDGTFSVLVNRCAAAHEVVKAKEIFYKRKEYGLQLDVMAFQELMMYLCRYKHVEDAETLFLQKQVEFPPDIKSWNIVLNGWCVLGSYREAKRVWKDIICSGCKPDLFTYGTFINALTKAGKLTTALKMFSKMWEKGHHPDVIICNCIIDSLCFKKRIPEALSLFSEMSRCGCRPNVGTYNSLIKHICKIRRMEKAYELLDEMEQKGVPPDARTYTYFLKTSTNPDEVGKLLERMEKTGCKIDSDTCNLILNLYVRWNHLSGVQSLWTKMEANGLGPDRRSYTVLIHGLHHNGKFDEAWEYFLQMQAKGMIPEPRTLLLMKESKEIEYEPI